MGFFISKRIAKPAEVLLSEIKPDGSQLPGGRKVSNSRAAQLLRRQQ
jgi:hypothetical protein